MMEGFLVVHVVALVTCLCASADDENNPSQLPGHLQPLGSHMEPEAVMKVSELITPSQFMEQYVRPRQPVVFEGIMKEIDVRKNWANDAYLRERFGEEIVEIEQGKKENRSLFSYSLTLREYLDEYNSSDIYMVSSLRPPMYTEWKVPKFLLCGGFTESFMFVNIWFSSGGTKSVLHTDSYENLHCLVSGRKEFVMIEPHYADVIGPEHETQGFYNMDVEKVDMNVYPELSKIPWYKAVVNEGDCLYIPHLWIHHVDSYNRNMGVNIWWSKILKFDKDDCSNEVELPDFISLGNFDLHPELQLTGAMEHLSRDDGTVHAEDVYNLLRQLGKGDSIGEEDVHKMMDILKPGSGGVVELSSITLAKYREAFEFIGELEEQYHQSQAGKEDHEPHDARDYGEFDDDHMTGGGDYELPTQHEYKRESNTSLFL